MTSSGADLVGRTLHPGDGHGPVVHLDEPVSFWGGVDGTGRIVDVHHPQHGTGLAGTVLVMASGRGSSSAAAVLAEQIRAGAAPAAVVLGECDTILVVGALVAAELYDVLMPVVSLPPADLDRVRAGTARVRADPDTLVATVRVEGGA